MHKLVTAVLPVVLSPALIAQVQGYQGPIPELGVNNTFRVVSTGTNPVTGANYPAAGTTPPGFVAAPGVPAGTRAWTHTPQLRAQAGATVGHYITIQGMTQAIFAGSAVTTFPAPNHYQFRCGIAPTQDPGLPYMLEHATTGADIFSIADASLAVNANGIVEHFVTVTTPVQLAAQTEWLFYVEYRGGEWRDDPNGGQTIAADWQGIPGPARQRFAGWALGSNPRTLQQWGTQSYRPKIGLLVDEPVFTMTGNYANAFENPPLAGEEGRGVSAARAYFSGSGVAPPVQPNMFFNIRAGQNYGSTGVGVVFLNVGTSWFPASIPIGSFGNLLLNPADPALGVISFLPLVLQANGIYQGDSMPSQQFNVPALGRSSRNMIIKAQGIVFNSGFANAQFTTASGLIIE